ncbi:MAG: hypothetical protein QXP53_00095 [Candidatus Pacearchaeota archaeon]
MKLQKTLIITVLISFLVLAGCKVPLREEPEDIRECIVDTDCMKIQTSCCPCSQGGSEDCISIAARPIYESLMKDCPKDPVCIQQYNCHIIKCICQNSTCEAVFNVTNQT